MIILLFIITHLLAAIAGLFAGILLTNASWTDDLQRQAASTRAHESYPSHSS